MLSILLTSSVVSHDFGFTLDQINWLSNVVSFVYIPSSLLVPLVTKRWGIRLTVRVSPSRHTCGLPFDSRISDVTQQSCRCFRDLH